MAEGRRALACAIYTRKSTEHGLEQDFNSLHAQREAAEAFVKSQAHEGWRCLPDAYDDGGLSGGTLEQPALARLLKDVEAGRVQVVVVYKIDRLTRSLSDFARLVELFDRHGVSFVSVTQQFNTTTSMGRLTLNVLLSFAQFEREVIGERVRDKIAASKRKGLWVGGPVPMGYTVQHKKPVIDEATADQVRFMFTRYLELGCLSALQRELNERGVRSLVRKRSDGRVCGGTPIGRGALSHILRNRFYVGEVAYKGHVYAGEQPTLITREVFEAVQVRLDANAVERRNQRHATQALLTGLLFDSAGHAMSPSHANKAAVRYRYYISQALLQARSQEAGTVSRVSAPDLEDTIITALQAHRPTPETTDRELVRHRVERITVHESRIEIRLRGDTGHPHVSPEASDQDRTLTILWTPRRGARHEVISPGAPRRISAHTRHAMLSAIARARAAVEALARGRDIDLTAIAAREGVSARYLRAQLPLAFLSPKIGAAIAAGEMRSDVTLTELFSASPLSWDEQEAKFGVATR